MPLHIWVYIRPRVETHTSLQGPVLGRFGAIRPYWGAQTPLARLVASSPQLISAWSLILLLLLDPY